MARLRRTTIVAMAMKALLLLAVLSLLPCAAIADVEASMPALFAHIREIQQLTRAAHGEVEEPDLDGSLGVAKAVDPEEVLQKTDATSQLFAHIYEVQQMAAEKLERLNDEAETETDMEMELEMETIVKDEKEEEEEEVDSGGVVDALVQARFNQLEATLKLLNDNDATESMQWSADGDDTTNLLQQFVQERQLKKRHLERAGQESQLEKDQHHEAVVEHGEIGHRDNHGDRDHENAHANSELSGLSDALYQKDDHNDHSHGQQHEESFKNMNFIPPEEEKEVDAGGVMDSLVQERFSQLEAALRFLNDKDGGDSMRWNADAAVTDDPINLLDQFVQERQQKHHQESRLEDEQTHEATTVDHGDIDLGHRNDHGNCEHVHGHQRDHGDTNANAGAHYRNRDHQHGDSYKRKKFVSSEEIAEEEDLLLYGFEGQEYPSAEYLRRSRVPELGVWLRAMGCSLLVSLASLICLMILPCIVSNGKPSETVVNALASFGAGVMLGDAFLQLSHALGNSESSYSKDEHQHHNDNGHTQAHKHEHISSAGQGHAHSLQDLSIVLAVLGGILLFFIVEKIVRRYEELSSQGGQRARGHNHHHRKKKNRAKKSESPEKIAASEELGALEFKESNSLETKSSDLTKRRNGKKKDTAAGNVISKAPVQLIEASGGFVIGYLNLFSDAVHNFTDGMALGSAFLLHGTVGGWSRTLFLLAHELPQEVGDFGILVKSGFSVFEALAFNFLSALVALAGTAVALLLGGSLRHSSLIEGFIAGGFIYISVGGVMPSMHIQGSSLTSTISQLMSMVLGMGVAIVVSLAE